MYLKSIELIGFKSFAKKSVLAFEKPITAIVGPNGSGKSNVTEAFRFALGEQSIKSMRGERSEDLIWNGSAELGGSSRAAVKVLFDNKKKVLDLDFDEVAIERIVFRDGASEYFLNNSQVRLKDIVEVLSPANVGPSGHHIISQGEADKILNTNTIERRAMIEDALGLRVYHYKKQESLRKLEKTKENIERVKLLQSELAPHIKFLKKQYEKFEKTKLLRADLLKLSLEYFAAQKRYLALEKERIESERKIPERRLEEIQESVLKATQTLAQGQHDEKKAKIVELETQLRQLRTRKDGETRNLGRIEGQLVSLQNLSKAPIHERITLEKGELEQLRTEIRDLKEVSEKSEDVFVLKSLFKKAFDLLSQIIGKNSPTSEEPEFNRTLIALEEEKKDITNVLVDLEKREEEITNAFKTLQLEIEKEKDQGREMEKNVFALKAEESELRAKINGLREVKQRLAIEEENYKSDLREVKVLVGEALFESSPENIQGEQITSEERVLLHREIEKIKIRLEDSGAGGEEVEKEFKEISERSVFLAKELTDLEQSAGSLKNLIKDLEEELGKNFKSGISKINQKFDVLFRLMFDGGSASLILVKEKKKKKRTLDDESLLENNEEDEEEDEESPEGLDIKISLPRKKIKSLDMLSGGERALTSIALIFAVSQVNPPPFLILDETDAALDEANSRRYGDMLESLSQSSQLILITHNRETMSRAGIIYGITMGHEGYSRVLSIAFEEAVTVAKS